MCFVTARFFKGIFRLLLVVNSCDGSEFQGFCVCACVCVYGRTQAIPVCACLCLRGGVCVRKAERFHAGAVARRVWNLFLSPGRLSLCKQHVNSTEVSFSPPTSVAYKAGLSFPQPTNRPGTKSQWSCGLKRTPIKYKIPKVLIINMCTISSGLDSPFKMFASTEGACTISALTHFPLNPCEHTVTH